MEEQNVLDYRLTQIEASVKEVRDLIVESKLQRKDIDDIKEDVKRNSADIATLKAIPGKKWVEVTKLILQTILVGVVSVVLVKIGLK